MEQHTSQLTAKGLTDEYDRLLSADQGLAELQKRCGGSIPGTVAVPELLQLVVKSRQMSLRIARSFAAHDGDGLIRGFVRIEPLDADAGGGCEISIDNLQRQPPSSDDDRARSVRDDAIDRGAAEISIRLGADQSVKWVTDLAPDASALSERIEASPGQHWSSYFDLQGVSYQQPLHWRLLDGARCRVPSSAREWRVRLFPHGGLSDEPQWFELLLIPDEALAVAARGASVSRERGGNRSGLVGNALTPALRQPVARIIANAETIKSRLAGPLRQEYSEYAGNIAAAGQHLTAMLEDLADLEVVESPGFSTIREEVELGDAARRAGGILGVRAQERGIELVLPDDDDTALALAEFRRVLQILINLIGNALAYSPSGSTVKVALAKRKSDPVAIIVQDEGPGVSAEQASRIFEKFERLGREDQTGSGLGLYISRKLALAMGGDLVLDSNREGGAKFRLNLPAANPKKKKG